MSNEYQIPLTLKGVYRVNTYQKRTVYISIIALTFFFVLSITTHNWGFILWGLLPVFIVVIKKKMDVPNMKWIPKGFVGLCFAFALTGCIGENYDFTPPSASIMSNPDLTEGELEAANIDWDSDKTYTQTTDDIYSLAKEQKPLHYYSGQQMDVLFDNGDIKIQALSVYVVRDGEKTELPMDGRTFDLPEAEGEYVIVVDLQTDSGSAEYVGNLVIEKRDYTPYPPTVSLAAHSDEPDELVEVKAVWQQLEPDGKYTNETDDLSSFIRDQKQLHYDAGQQVELLFDHHDFEMIEIRVHASQDDKKTDLSVNDKTFYLPAQAGEYVIVVDLLTDKGNAQYVGNIIIP